MISVKDISQLPNIPAIYALYGGRARNSDVAYVGMADKLRQRIRQHLITRDSSVTTGVAVVSLNPKLVTAALWWEHTSFSELTRLAAAELVAFDVLEPTLRSRGSVLAQACQLYDDARFYAEMSELFKSEPSGRLDIPTVQDMFDRIRELEQRIAALEGKHTGQ